VTVLNRHLLILLVFVIGVSPASFAAGDAVHGKQVFQRCAICHKVEKGAGGGLGPNLFGVFGRKAASEPGFNYSGVFKRSGLTWTEDNLVKWVSGPAKMVPGTKMAFAGLTAKKDQADVVAYLATLK